MAASGMGLCRQSAVLNKRYGFSVPWYGFQSKCTFQRLTPVDPPGKSSWWGVLAVAPAMLHVTTTVRHLGHDLGMIWEGPWGTKAP